MDYDQIRSQMIGGGGMSARAVANIAGYLGAAAVPAAAILSPLVPVNPELMLGAAAASGCLLGMAIGTNPIRPRARRAEAKRPLLVDPTAAVDGLIVGVRQDGSPVIWRTKDQTKHGMIIGKTGSGKSVALRNLAVGKIARGSGAGVLEIDAKPSLRAVRELLWIAKQCGREDDVRILLPGHPEMSHTFNPLKWGSVPQLVNLLTQMKRYGSNASTQFYTNQQRNMLAAVLGVLKERRQPFHWGDVLAGVKNPKARDFLASWGPASSPARAQLKNALEGYQNDRDGFDERRYKQEMSGVVADLEQFIWTDVDANVGRILLAEHGEVDMYDVVRNGRICYVGIPTATQDTNAWIWALLVVRSLMAVMGRLNDEGHNPREPFLALLDELKMYLTDSVATLFALARSSGISIVGGIQAISMMRSPEGDLDGPILDNTQMKQMFSMGGAVGAQAAAEQIGKSIQLMRSVNLGDSRGRSVRPGDLGMSSRNESQSMSAREMRDFSITPESLQKMSVGECIHVEGGDFCRVRAPLFQVPEEELPPLELRHYTSSSEAGVGLYDRYLRGKGTDSAQAA